MAIARRLADGEAEICGLGVVRVDDDDPLALHRIPDSVRELAHQRLALAMASSREAGLRAAERLFTARRAVGAAAIASAAEADAACRSARDLGLAETARFCAEEQKRSQAALLEPAAMSIDELARLAATTGDPQVYAFAFEACHPRGLNFVALDGNCQLVTAEQWARLAPDNAAPWLQLAAQALAAGDTPAANAALVRAAAAKTIASNAEALVALATSALPAGMPLLEQTAVQAELAQLGVGSEPVALDTVGTVCGSPALVDGERHALCDALAVMLVERGQSSSAVTTGVQLGERLGWPAERTSAVLREQRAARDAVLRYTAAAQELACDSLQRQRELVLLAGRMGEYGASRELLRREREGGAALRRQ